MTSDQKPNLLLRKIKLSWHKALRHLIPLGGISQGNKLWFYHHGDQAFAAIHYAISNAEESIFVETYLWAPDRVGTWIRDALIRAQERGLKVTILYDHFGSSKLTRDFLAPLKEAGVIVLEFNPIWPWRRHGPLLFRDHRKIIVIDNKYAFCGSMNISDDYAGPTLGNNKFRDSLVRIEGPAAQDLLNITLESIAESEFKKSSYLPIKKLKNFLPLRTLYKELFKAHELIDIKAREAVLQVLQSNRRKNLQNIQSSMEECLDRAMDYCYFTTPYFLPYAPLRDAILRAKQRGVDVRILTAGLSDVPLMHWAMQHVYTRFLKANVRIYEMKKKTLHAKLATIDGVYASIGSYNLDHWSARRNLEVNISILDTPTALDLKEQFYHDLQSSKEIELSDLTRRSYVHRFISWLCYQFFKL